MKRMFEKILLNNKVVKFQLDTGSDMTLINEQTWKKIGTPSLSKTEKLKGLVRNRTQNLFSIDWIESFDLLNEPIITFCFSVRVNFNSMEKLKKEFMIKFPEFFSEGLGKCTNFKATSKIKEIVTPIFRLNRKYVFASEASISKDLDRL